MAQKVLSGRASDPTLAGDLVTVRIDQVALSASPVRVVADALAAGMKKASAEVAVVYSTRPVSAPGQSGGDADVPPEALAAGLVLARAGAGFVAPVHLERFASPARLCVTDDPRLVSSGGAGMLTLAVSAAELARALATGTIEMRPPQSLQIVLAGKLRPFVCARDAALELVRRGVGDMVRRIEEQRGAPVVLELSGPGARLLSASERAVVCSIAPELGAASAVFVSDERTEVYLRDQRRSKAYRALVPDAGAQPAAVVNVDLGAIDPLLVDEAGAVRPVRDLAGRPVSQVILGADGATLRDLFAVATLLKSKRVAGGVDWLLAPPSRQTLEALAAEGALADLLATGARLVEPDARIFSGELYPAPPTGVSVRSFDPAPRARMGLVTSPETLAYAVAHGVVGDPRSFKRPVRVTVPRVLPTDDVLLVTEKERRLEADPKRGALVASSTPPWKPGALDVVSAPPAPGAAGPVAVACATLEDVRAVAAMVDGASGQVRAIVAPFVPSAMVTRLSAAGVFVLSAKDAGKKVDVAAAVAGQKGAPAWLARGAERGWLAGAPSSSARLKR